MQKKYDEMDILAEIYRMRGLTVTQLCEVFFETRHYAYKYLGKLKNDGLLSDKYHMARGKSQGKVFSCTDKAIERLTEAGRTDRKVMAQDNTPAQSRLRTTVLTNELYSALMPYGIKVFDSREWKRKHDMDRNTLVRGGLQMMDDSEIAVYLFFSPAQVRGGGIQDVLFYRFKKEILGFTQSNKFAIICYDEKTYKRLVDGLTDENKAMAKEQLSVIPYGHSGFGFDILKLSRHQEERKHDIEQVLNARLYENHAALVGDKLKFTKYIAEKDGKESYVVDFLSMDLTVIHFLDLQYYHNVFLQDGRPVDLVCWQPNVMQLTKKFENYPHVNIVPVSINTAKEWLNRMEPQKIQI
jgi:DNA-binding MarR family transcriptional regulator